MKTGIELISQERKDQIEKHGYSEDHDKDHTGGSLALNAAILASPQVLYQMDKKYANKIEFQVIVGDTYDWNIPYLAAHGNTIKDNSTLSKKERIKQLVVAGALIAAEIDRINKLK